MSTVFYFTGALVWIGIALLLLLLAWEVFLAFVRAASWARWVLAVHRVYGGVKSKRALFRQFFREWRDFIGSREGGTCWHGKHGYWEGVGKWGVYPPESGSTE